LWLDIVHPEDIAIFKPLYKKMYRGELIKSEYRIVDKHGSIRWVHAKIKPRTDENGRYNYFDGTLSDITKKRNASLELEKSEKKYRNIFSASLDAIFEITPDGLLANMNSAGLRLFGFDVDEVGDVLFADLFDNSFELAECSMKMEKGTQIRNYEAKLKNKNGGIIDVLLSVSHRTDDAGHRIGHHCIARDITELKVLSGLLPICSHCKKIRDDKGYWTQVESYIGKNSNAKFTHGICPDCLETHYTQDIENL
jgi:PAS domain S-box-containing protein